MNEYYDDSFDYDDEDSDYSPYSGALEEYVDSIADIDDLGPELSCQSVHPQIIQHLFLMGADDLLEKQLTPFIERMCSCLSSELAGVLTGEIKVDYPFFGNVKVKAFKLGEPAADKKEAMADALSYILYLAALSGIFVYKQLRDEYGE